ncbi:MAG: radical SAM protein [archaeon]
MIKLKASETLNKVKINSNTYYIYDSLFGNLTRVNSDIIKLISYINAKDYIAQNEKLNKRIKETINFLKSNNFLVPNNFNPRELLITRFKDYIKEAKSGKFITNLRLNITDSCNCTCRYCYVHTIKGKKSQSISENTAKQAITKFIYMAKKNNLKHLTIRFFGGEPLLYPELIKNLMLYSNNLSKKYHIRVHYIINTNGTIMSKEIAGTFSRFKVGVIVSLDGMGLENDRNRVFANGKGTFEIINKTLDLLLKYNNKVIISTVINPGSSYRKLKQFIDYLRNKGIKFVGINPLQKYDKKYYRYRGFRKVAKMLIAIKKYGLRKGIFVNGSWEMLFLKLTHPSFSYCGGIGKELSVNPNGDIYPCSALSTKWGNIKNLDKIPKTSKYISILNRSIPFLRGCINCEIEAICSGGCAAESEFVFGDMNQPAPGCYFRRYLTKQMILEDNPKLFTDRKLDI